MRLGKDSERASLLMSLAASSSPGPTPSRFIKLRFRYAPRHGLVDHGDLALGRPPHSFVQQKTLSLCWTEGRPRLPIPQKGQPILSRCLKP